MSCSRRAFLKETLGGTLATVLPLSAFTFLSTDEAKAAVAESKVRWAFLVDATACIGCGQCSNACPNDIPVMELFRTVASGTQTAFEYEAGRSLDEKPPLTEFREDEFSDVVGIGAS